jgi:DNA-binding transcriptional MerR regulator
VVQSLKIGDLSRRTRCPSETIRYYEREGLQLLQRQSKSLRRQCGAVHVEKACGILDELRRGTLGGHR